MQYHRITQYINHLGHFIRAALRHKRHMTLELNAWHDMLNTRKEEEASE